MEKEVDSNLLISMSLFVIIFLFLIIQPISLTGFVELPLVGDTSELSNPILIGGIALLVLIWVALIVLYIKLKKKKQLQKLPDLPETVTPIPSISTQMQPEKKKGTLSEDELKELFKEIAPTIESSLSQKKEVLGLPEKQEVEKPILEKQIIEIKRSEQLPERRQDLMQLKNLILDLLNKSYTRESIVKYLQKKGWKLNQMALVIKDINEANLRNYIKEAVSLGYTRQQFTPLLLTKGWTINDIDRAR